MATSRRRGLEYEIRSEDRFSTTIEAFITKINRAKRAWVSFRAETSRGGTSSASGAAKATARHMQEVEGATRQANTQMIRFARNIRRSATAATSLAASMNRVAANTAKATVAQARTNQGLQRAGLFAANLNSRLARTLVIFGRILGIFALFRGLQAVFGAIGAAIREAVGFSSRIEDSKIAIQALIASVFDIADASGAVVTGAEKFRLAFKFAEEQVRALRIEGLRTAATFDQLLDTFQVAIAPGAQAGLPLEQIRQLAVSISQAAQAIGVPQNQLAEEIRSLLTGTISKRTTRIATALGIENEDIENARELGTLFEFLTGQFEQFGTASATALQNFSTRLANLKDAVGQTLSEGLTGSFLELKDLILDITESLVDIGNLRISKPFLELLDIFDSLGQELIGGLRNFVQDLDLDRVAILFQGVADSVRVMVAGFLTVSEVVLPIVETFTLIFSTIVGIARSIDQATGVLSAFSALMRTIVSLWAIVKALQLATFLLGGKAVKQLFVRLGLLKLIKNQWKQITVAATAATAASGVAQGAALAGGAGALAGAGAALVAGLPFLLTAISAISLALLIFNADIRKTFSNFLLGSREAEEGVEGFAQETVTAFLLVDNAVKQAEEAIETLSNRFDDLNRKARESEFLEGFSGVAREAAGFIGGLQIEFDKAIQDLDSGAEASRQRIAELIRELDLLGINVPVSQLNEAIALINGLANTRNKIHQLTLEIVEAREAMTGFGDATQENIIFLNKAEIARQEKFLRGSETSLKRMGVDTSLIAASAERLFEITSALIPLSVKLGNSLATDAALRASIVANVDEELRVLNARLRDNARKRAIALQEERTLSLALLQVEVARAALDDPGQELQNRVSTLRTEFELRRAALQLQLDQTRELHAANQDVEQLEETIVQLVRQQDDLTKEFANAVLDELIPALAKANEETNKLRLSTQRSVAETLTEIGLLGVDELSANITRAIIEQERQFTLTEQSLRSVRREIQDVLPLFKALGIDDTVLEALELIESKLASLPEQLGQAKAGAVGAIVTAELANARQEVTGLLEDARRNLEEVQAVLGSEGIARDLTLISRRIRQQFSDLRDDLTILQTRVLDLSQSAADSGAVITAGIFAALANAIEEQIKLLNQGELQVLKDEVRAFATEVGESLDIENRGLSRQLRIQQELNRIEQEGFAARTESSIVSLQQQEARLRLEREFALADLDRQTAQLSNFQSVLESLGIEVDLKTVLLELDTKRFLISQQTAEALVKLQELLKRERQREEDPEGFFFDTLPTKAKVTADRTIEALTTIKDFLIDDLSGALVDSLFRDENTLLERAQRLAEQLVQIFLKEFLQNQLFGTLLTSGGTGGSTGGGGDGTFAGGLVNRAKATWAHFSGWAKGFTSGGPVGGGGSSPTGFPGSGPIRPPSGIDPRDNVPAWLSAKEYVMPVNAVSEYGMAVMDALRARRIPSQVMKALLGSSRTFSRPRSYGGSSLAFHQGGPVPAVQGAGSPGGTTIINATNQRDIYDAITTTEGRDVVLNVVRFGRDNGLV